MKFWWIPVNSGEHPVKFWWNYGEILEDRIKQQKALQKAITQPSHMYNRSRDQSWHHPGEGRFEKDGWGRGRGERGLRPFHAVRIRAPKLQGWSAKDDTLVAYGKQSFTLGIYYDQHQTWLLWYWLDTCQHVVQVVTVLCIRAIWRQYNRLWRYLFHAHVSNLNFQSASC